MAELQVFDSGGRALRRPAGQYNIMLYAFYFLQTELPMAELQVFDSGGRASRSSSPAGQYNIAYRDRHQDGPLIRSPSSSLS